MGSERPDPEIPNLPEDVLADPPPAPDGAAADDSTVPEVDPGANRELQVELPPEIRADESSPDPAPGEAAPSPVLVQTSISPRHKLEAWIAEMVRLGASDLILRAGGKPSCRIDCATASAGSSSKTCTLTIAPSRASPARVRRRCPCSCR